MIKEHLEQIAGAYGFHPVDTVSDHMWSFVNDDNGDRINYYFVKGTFTHSRSGFTLYVLKKIYTEDEFELAITKKNK